MRLGDYTIDGGIRFVTNAVAGTEENYLFDSTAETALAAADFVIVTVISGTTLVSIRFDSQGDGGSGALLAVGTGSSTAANTVWKLHTGHALYLPASIFAANSTRTGRMECSTASSNFHFTFCSWNASSVP